MSFSLSPPPDSLAFICLLLWQIGLTSITMLYEVMVTRGTLITPPRLPKHTHTVWSLSVFLCLLLHPLCSLISELIALCHPLQCILVLSPSVCSVCVCVWILAGRGAAHVWSVIQGWLFSEGNMLCFLCGWGVCLWRGIPNEGHSQWPLSGSLMHPRPPKTGWLAGCMTAWTHGCTTSSRRATA